MATEEATLQRCRSAPEHGACFSTAPAFPQRPRKKNARQELEIERTKCAFARAYRLAHGAVEE
jgi:hypothetical protein